MHQTSSLLPHRSVISLSGSDAMSLLQGLVSNDVTHATATQAVAAALLTPQGRFLYAMFVLNVDGEFWLECAASQAEELIAKLNKHKLRSAVTLHDRRSTHGVALNTARGFLLYADPRHPALPARSILSREELPAVDTVILAGHERQRLELGIPEEPDLIVGETLLLEANYDYLRGVDFKKGCYLGQEMTARTHYRKLIKRRLVPVRCLNEANCPATGTPLMASGQAVGIMRSSQDVFGMALLNLSAVLAETLVTAGTHILQPHRPDWLPATAMATGAG